ncbi:MAG: cob(I)yrinic acid a,c-diamide adenosyltransferase [Parcubacteria group bacterium]|nr:cob(I)yrinic acid a,c-diamide adenosyltransferase [Parcubacteria group bacterium]
MLIVVTGNGKGKTTSALGQALRVIGEGGRAVMYQFIKGPWKSGEDKLISNLKSQNSKLKDKKSLDGLENLYDFDIVKGGKGFVGILGDPYPRSVHIKAAEETWTKAQAAIESKKYQLVVLDEINVAIKLGLIKVGPVFSFLKKHKGIVNIMATGRDAHPRLIKLADLVSEIKDIKHPFNQGVSARRGIEY